MTNLVPAAVQATGRPGRWTAGPDDCEVTFTVRNFRVRAVTGRIPVTAARLTVGPDGYPSRIQAELDVRGIDTGDRRRDRDLRGPRFLATGQWPVATFTAEDIRPHGDGWTACGTLTVKDTPCPVQLDVAAPRPRQTADDGPAPWRAAAQFDRRAAGVTAGPGFLIGYVITVTLAIRLRPPRA